MGMNISSGDGDDQLNSTINTTPLVDVMLVMLIIFLITIPVVIKTVPVELPNVSNTPTITKPENIVIAVTKEGEYYWNDSRLSDKAALLAQLKTITMMKPQPEVHIRGDLNGRYEHVGRLVLYCQRAGISKIGFITEPTR
ncbi:MAG: biopolymer transporter ExbD [Cellvibrio sp.]|jgi:biopolymer transport protein ExbD|uniref:ExbD/TolR family protein n=1 Tax=Cellvibrio sp. TaxID=1965322 RepID=UPI0031B37F85